MATPEVNIPDIHVHIHLPETYGNVPDENVEQQLNAGVSPEALRDIGYDVSEGATALSSVSETVQEKEERMQSSVERIDMDMAKAMDRKANLRKALQYADEYANRKGHLTTSDNPPEKRSSIQALHLTAKSNGEESLKTACGMCQFAGRCSLKGDFDKWFDTKPYKSKIPERYHSPTYPIETRKKFYDRLAENPKAHCRPPIPKRKAA